MSANFDCLDCASEFHSPDALVAHEVKQHNMTVIAAREDVTRRFGSAER